MKITKLTTYIVPPRWLFLKVETDEGIVGWGEPVVEGRALTVQAAVHELEDYLIGKDPFLIEDHWNVMYRGGFYRGGAVHMSAHLRASTRRCGTSRARRSASPSIRCSAARCRDKIKVYSWIGGDRPADVASNAKDVVARGFKAIKLNGCEEMQIVDSHDKIEKAVETIATIREAVGPYIGIGVDFHGRVHKPMAKVLAKELDPYKLMFIEEPVLSENKEALTRHRQPLRDADRARRTAVFALGFQAGPGRRLCRHHPAGSLPCRRHHRDAARSRRWPRPMTWRWRRIARSGRSRSPPACRSMPSATMPSSRNRASASTTTRATISSIISNKDPPYSPDGFVAIPQGPGLGIEVDEQVVERAKGHRWRNPIWRHEDGSFAEW